MGGEIHAGAILHQGSQLCNLRLPQSIIGKKLEMSSCPVVTFSHASVDDQICRTGLDWRLIK